MNPFIEEIKHHGELLSVIISDEFKESGIHFFTPDHLSQQVAYMKHPKGKQIDPHIHQHVLRKVTFTQEVLVVKEGKLKVDFYDNDKNYLQSRVLRKGDVILLVSGGHGFEVLEEVEMIEIKQGPYVGEMDKVRFKKK